MNLRSIKLKNIRSYESEEIIFPEGSTLLSGDIGSGKTSILLAIEFAFFGLQPGQRGSALLANGKEQGSVNLQFELDGNIIEIERTLKRGSKTVTQDFAAISIGGVKNVTSVTELKTKVLELLNYPAEFVKKTNLLYRYTVYTPQEEMKRILVEDTDTRLNTLRKVFNVDKYKKIRENVSVFIRSLKEKKKEFEGFISDFEEKKKELYKTNKEMLDLDEKIKVITPKVEKAKQELVKKREKISVYECGFNPFEDTRSRFEVRFYIVAILFIIFDLEIVFLFPWVIVLNLLPFYGFLIIFLFIIILLVGFIYEWFKGALEWE